MIDLVRNGYIGKLEWIDVWSRNVNVYTNGYNGKPYGSETEIPIPADLDFDAWQGPSPMVPYTSDRTTALGGYNCPETSLGFLTCAGIHPLGVAQWGNNADHTSPIRYEGSGNIPTSGIFRTLENWDVMCEYENGVKLRMRDCFNAKEDVKKYYPSVKNNDGVVFFGTEGWIGNFDYHGTFDASNRKIWKQKFKSTDKRIPTIAEGHVKNFIDCVKSREKTTMPVEAAIRLDATAHMINVAAQTKRVIKWDPKQEKIIGDKEAAKIITRPYRKKWKVW
ncbi:MAG: hypothetical protein GY794_11295 [bacterium]|nr:hypothetical protein [bacterium]